MTSHYLNRPTRKFEEVQQNHRRSTELKTVIRRTLAAAASAGYGPAAQLDHAVKAAQQHSPEVSPEWVRTVALEVSRPAV